MRTLVVVPYLALAVAFAVLGVALPKAAGEPTEAQMHIAVRAALEQDVRHALAFAAETGGEAALADIRRKGLDRFELTALRKGRCHRLADSGHHVCDFTVDIEVVTGAMRRALTGRFIAESGRLVFLQDV